MSNAPVKPGDLIAGKYRIERIIGEGGMGVVASARHLALDHLVAIKLMRIGGTAPVMQERFMREARAAAKLTTQHVAKVFDVGTTESGEPFMAMELLDGRDLAAELAVRGPLPIAEAVGYVLQAIEAVAEAHAEGIVHRDLKPANMFLAQGRGGDACVKVVDFGISKMSGGSLALTRDQTPMGSPFYMSPEQTHSSRDVDGRTDVWALGASLYELLAGKTPFDCERAEELMSRIYTKPPTPLSAYRTDVPAGLESVLQTCLEKDRERRWPNVAGLAAALVPYGPPGADACATRAAVTLGEKLEPTRPTIDLMSAVGPGGSRGAGTSGALVSSVGQGAGSRRVGAAAAIGIGVVALVAAGVGIGRWQWHAEPTPAGTGSAVPGPAASSAVVAPTLPGPPRPAETVVAPTVEPAPTAAPSATSSASMPDPKPKGAPRSGTPTAAPVPAAPRSSPQPKPKSIFDL